MTRPKPNWTPPPRDGVGPSRVAVGDGRHGCLLDFLVARFPHVADWPQRLAQGEVLDAGGGAADAGTPCAVGQAFWYWRKPPPETRLPFEVDILFQDDYLVVVDKPHFMSVTPGGRHLTETVLVRLKQQLGSATLAPMHRLDRDTAGVLVFTRQPATRHAYQSLLKDRQVQKVYEAVAPWRPDLALPLVYRSRMEPREDQAFMQMQVLAGEPNAETRIALIHRIGPALAHYRLEPHTGRKHQLRVHMNELGLPIVGDRIYPTLLPDTGDDYRQPLQLLAREFGFSDPITGEPRHFTSRRRLSLDPDEEAGVAEGAGLPHHG